MNKKVPLKILCVIIGTLALMCLGLGYGWSVFRGAFRILYPQWTEMMLSFVFSLSMIFFGVGSFICGFLLRKFSLRRVILIGTAVFFTGFGGVSLLPQSNSGLTIAGLYLLYGVLSGSGIGICYNAINSSVPRFFPKCKGTISGFMMAGYGSGALILGVIASRLIQNERIGLFLTFRILAVAIAAVLLCAVCVYGVMDVATEKAIKNTPAAELKGFSPTQVLRLSSFWVLQLRNVLSYAACLMIVEQAGNLAEHFGMAATAGLVLSVSNGLFRIPSGILCDRIGCVRTLRVGNALLLIAVAMLGLLQFNATPLQFFLCFILFGMSYGVTPPVSVSINEEFFGAKYRTVNYAFFSFTLAPASLLGPTVLGFLRDRFGNTIGLTVNVVLVYAVLALILSLLIRKPDQSEW